MFRETWHENKSFVVIADSGSCQEPSCTSDRLAVILTVTAISVYQTAMTACLSPRANLAKARVWICRRLRLRQTIETCQSGSGFCLGSGNTVADYIAPDDFLVMIDERRLYGMG